jgi:hypothetical protein
MSLALPMSFSRPPAKTAGKPQATAPTMQAFFDFCGLRRRKRLGRLWTVLERQDGIKTMPVCLLSLPRGGHPEGPKRTDPVINLDLHALQARSAVTRVDQEVADARWRVLEMTSSEDIAERKVAKLPVQATVRASTATCTVPHSPRKSARAVRHLVFVANVADALQDHIQELEDIVNETVTEVVSRVQDDGLDLAKNSINKAQSPGPVLPATMRACTELSRGPRVDPKNVTATPPRKGPLPSLSPRIDDEEPGPVEEKGYSVTFQTAQVSELPAASARDSDCEALLALIQCAAVRRLCELAIVDQEGDMLYTVFGKTGPTNVKTPVAPDKHLERQERERILNNAAG